MAPLFWMFMSSFMPLEQVGVFPVEWIPRVWQPENYTDALKFWKFGTTFRNTMIITIFSLIGDIGSCTLVAYGFARFRFPFRDTLFLILLATLMLPFAVRLIPVYAAYDAIGWIDTFYPLDRPELLWQRLLHIYLPAVLPRHPAGSAGRGQDRRRQRVPHFYPSDDSARQARHRRHRHP